MSLAAVNAVCMPKELVDSCCTCQMSDSTASSMQQFIVIAGYVRWC